MFGKNFVSFLVFAKELSWRQKQQIAFSVEFVVWAELPDDDVAKYKESSASNELHHKITETIYNLRRHKIPAWH